MQAQVQWRTNSGGITSIRYNNRELMTGAGSHLIGDCANFDDPASNISSAYASGRMVSPNGSCAGAPFKVEYLRKTGNTLRFKMTVGPYPVDYTNLKKRNAVTHWITKGIDNGTPSSPVLHAVYYIKQNPFVGNLYGKTNYRAAVRHWIRYGHKDGLNSSPVFHAKYYMEQDDLRGVKGVRLWDIDVTILRV